LPNAFAFSDSRLAELHLGCGFSAFEDTMSEFRRDPLSGGWVIIAENRAGRPDEFRQTPRVRTAVACPFCSGHERETPEAVAVYPASASPPASACWQVRVVPNKFPAVWFAAPAGGEAAKSSEKQSAQGAHEVIIESPQHVVSLADTTDQQARLTFLAYQDRLRHWRSDSRLAYGLVFKNARAEGGASLEHAHSQLIATPMLPDVVATEARHCKQFSEEESKCLLCDLAAQELASRDRLVHETQHLVAICPCGSRFPFEVLVLPKEHASYFEEVEGGVRDELAFLVRDLIARLESLLHEPAYNFWIHTAPWSGGDFVHDSFHWHLHLAPRLTRLAGFELGAGYFINPVSPEKAAGDFRVAFQGNSRFPSD
jgi:UDPglucose--hexose-1-phosphate uridylyltransferase